MKDMENYYYILEGKNTKQVNDATEWAQHFEHSDRTVKKTELSNCSVSTVFLGINHRHGAGEPILFETMIFGGEHDGYCERYTTWEEAEEGHQRAIELIFEI